ncbi:MAG: hypothetical protein CSA32_00340 [Desulfobulbus propionicus]|nr:MAG: hypothetical protein CSA32_00340 [Desulfobulbus propionicus]
MRAVVALLLLSLIVCIPLGYAEEREQGQLDLDTVETLDLHTAQQYALQGNPNMAAARTRIAQARARIQQVIAAWWPSLDLSAAAENERVSDNTHAYNSLLASLYGGEAEQDSNQFSAGIQATWLLFDGFARHFQKQQAECGEQAYRFAFINAQRLLVQAVAEAYFNAQLAQTKIDIALADKKFYKRQLEDAQSRFDIGAGTWGDVINIKVQLNSAETSFILNKRELEASCYGLAALLGVPEARLPEKMRLQVLDKDTEIHPFREDVAALIDEALESRPDLQQAREQARQAESEVGLAKASFYPTAQLQGYIAAARGDDPAFTNDDFGNQISLNIAWNIFSGGADRALLAEARQAKREGQYFLNSLRNQIASEVRQGIARLRAFEDQVRLQRETVILVEENRELAKNEYEAGETSLVRLNEAQRDLTTTYGRLAQALVGYFRARQNLDSVTGRNLSGIVSAGQE